MPILTTKLELEKRLVAGFPGVEIARPSVAFTPPSGTMYLRCQMLIGKPDDPVFGVKYRRENITFQVFVVAPYNRGELEAFTTAQQVATLYARGTSIAVSNLLIRVFESPHISGSMIVDNRVIVPVMIPVVVQVFN